MMRFLLICVTAFGLGVLATGQSSQAGSAPAATPVSAAHGFAGLGLAGKPMSLLVQKAGYRCRRDCDWCRSACYTRFRVRCRGAYCRSNFTLCMRDCWGRICRWC